MAEMVAAGDLDFDFDIDYDSFFADEPNLDLSLDAFPPEALLTDTFSPSSDSSVESPTRWVNELEQFLLEEDGEGGDVGNISSPNEGFFADVFADNDEKGERMQETSESEEDPVVDKNEVVNWDERNGGGPGGSEERSAEETGDAVSKKRMRQLRNRDSAMKSRERKKIYVQGLEMKSKFLEAECKRLEHLLCCCRAENLVLKNSLLGDKGSGVSQAKQESAVLFEESLLLGSLFWFVSAAVFLSLVPNLLVWSLLAGVTSRARGQAVGQKLETEEAKRSGNESLGLGLAWESASMRRRYRALKPKLKTLLTCY